MGALSINVNCELELRASILELGYLARNEPIDFEPEPRLVVNTRTYHQNFQPHHEKTVVELCNK